MKKLNKYFWIGFIVGVIFTLIIFVAFLCWVSFHPTTDCNECLSHVSVGNILA